MEPDAVTAAIGHSEQVFLPHKDCMTQAFANRGANSSRGDVWQGSAAAGDYHPWRQSNKQALLDQTVSIAVHL